MSDLNYNDFISKDRCVLIAPAGYGKTHTIAECLKYTQGKQLILTHTHAGVSSIKEKLIKSGISAIHFHVETISGYVQKYVLAFYTGNDLPSQEDKKQYFPFILKKANELFDLAPVKRTVASSYNGLFVDEYQDCSIEQHEFIKKLSSLFPTRLLGDPLQGIFEFNSTRLVDLNSPADMSFFNKNGYQLTMPQRWIQKDGNKKLGDELKVLRKKLENSEQIDLSGLKQIKVHIAESYFKKYKEILEILTSQESVLVIDPNSSTKSSREKFIQTFGNIPRLIEAIDDGDFYRISKLIDKIKDSFTPATLEVDVVGLSRELFGKTGLNNWFNNQNRIKNSPDPEKAKSLKKLRVLVEELNEAYSHIKLAQILEYIRKLKGVKCYRKHLLNSIIRSAKDAGINKLSVYETMLAYRNSVRRSGRKVIGKCVGTTLLTKGLEFDIVIIINAHDFKCAKNLYVALTRATKKLIILSKESVLNPYSVRRKNKKRKVVPGHQKSLFE